MLETFRGSSLRTLSPLEDQAYNVLAPYAFKIFQKEFERATQYSVHQENRIEFVLQYNKDKTSQKHKVLTFHWFADAFSALAMIGRAPHS